MDTKHDDTYSHTTFESNDNFVVKYSEYTQYTPLWNNKSSTHPVASDLFVKTILTEQNEYMKHAVTTLEDPARWDPPPGDNNNDLLLLLRGGVIKGGGESVDSRETSFNGAISSSCSSIVIVTFCSCFRECNVMMNTGVSSQAPGTWYCTLYVLVYNESVVRGRNCTRYPLMSLGLSVDDVNCDESNKHTYCCLFQERARGREVF